MVLEEYRGPLKLSLIDQLLDSKTREFQVLGIGAALMHENPAAASYIYRKIYYTPHLKTLTNTVLDSELSEHIPKKGMCNMIFDISFNPATTN